LASEVHVSIDAVEDVSVLAEPVRVGELRIPNSLSVHPMEGADGDAQGRPGELTLRRYERFAAGGAGLIWVEATAVVPEGRSNPRQLWLSESSKAEFARLVSHITKVASRQVGSQHRPVLVLQLTHSGRYSKPEGRARPLICQHDVYRDSLRAQRVPEPTTQEKIVADRPAVTDDYLSGLIESYVRAARLAYEVGFDAVDVKACHGYLISELLACYQREGKYGGPFENRVRFLLKVIDRIGDNLGRDKAVVTRLGVYDGVPYPFGWGVNKQDHRVADLTEPKELVRLLGQRGVKMVNISIGDPHYNPHYGRPFNKPVIGGYEAPEHPLTGVGRLMSLTGEMQTQFPDVAVVGTGYSWLGTVMPNVAAAAKAHGLVTMVGVGRMGLAYPDFARDIIVKGKMDSNKVCIACSRCTQIMVDGGTIGCAVRDKRVYGPVYEQSRSRANGLETTV
jgi:2,4-dienoyl-CoA reductase-like NADH-dependent reductase (Old Yellow Enzyme family)